MELLEVHQPQCQACGSTRLRWETSHWRCQNCGDIIPCCEGEPQPER